jgi:hypothetical protein
MKKELLVLLFLFFYPIENVVPAEYSTWDGFEADKLASIWRR